MGLKLCQPLNYNPTQWSFSPAMVISPRMGDETSEPRLLFLLEWREYRGLTQEQLATAAGVSVATVSQLERGKHGFTNSVWGQLAKALGCSPVDLLLLNPSRPDSFWALFQTAELLQGRARQRAMRIIRAAIDPLAEPE